MKRLALLLLALTFALPLSAQSFEHVIIVIQENRTPDNLFGASGLPGGDLQIDTKLGKSVTLTTGPHDPPHNHSAYLKQAAGAWTAGEHDYVTGDVQPYWDLAAQYGWANYMFQTNQGSSYPAHQFLISGTSAPSDTSDLFIRSEPGGRPGCSAPSGSRAPLIGPNGNAGWIYPCFQRSSLLNLLDAAGLSWRYYSAAGIWNAPNSLKSYYQSPNLVTNPPRVLTDIANGTLANVSWVTPASAYSDHPGGGSGGPAWVASIVNAVGKSAYWENTAILVTWDDWGGFWDHVTPLVNKTGWCEEYCYGFRVPFLVISARTPAGYVDNEIHDFGSILRFVENNFSLGLIGPGGWADKYADDLSGFFPRGLASRTFVPITARKLTKKELADHGEPDTE